MHPVAAALAAGVVGAGLLWTIAETVPALAGPATVLLVLAAVASLPFGTPEAA